MSRFYRSLFIVWVALRYGLDELVLTSFQKPWLRVVARIVSFGRRLDAPRGQRLREALERLGPIFVKFGQVLSTRRDLLPPDIADELTFLQDRVPPFPSAVAVATIERAFRRPVGDVFVQFDETPIASASIAQVHFATIRTGDGQLREVAVKVLRPNMRGVIEKDLGLMAMMAGWVEKLSPDGKRLKPREVVAEFDKYLHDELDLVREAANAAQLRRNMEGAGPRAGAGDDVGSSAHPERHRHGAHERRADQRRSSSAARGGRRFQEAGARRRDDLLHAGVPRRLLPRRHAPGQHPGQPRAPRTFGRYVALDFGIIGTLTESDKDYLAQNFIAFFRRDYKRVAELHLESRLGASRARASTSSKAAIRACLRTLLRPAAEGDLARPWCLLRLFQTSRRFNVEIQPQLVLLQKTLLNIEGLGRQLDPELDLWHTAKPFLEKWMVDQIGPKKLFQQLKDEAPRYAKLLPELPRLLHDFLENRPPDHRRELLELLAAQKRTNRLLQSILYGGIGFVLGLLAMQLLVRVRIF